MSGKNINWHKVADTINAIDWQPNNMAIAELAGKTITLVKQNDSIKACAYKCPHASSVLAGGYVDALGNIVCPLHRYKFSLQNGRNVSGEGYYLKTYVVETRADGVYIGFEGSGLLNIFK